MSKMGRKPKYSEKLVAELCDRVAEGCSNKDAAILCDISEEIFYRWQRPTLDNGKVNPEYKIDLVESLKKAVAARKRKLVNDIVTEKSWQAKAWYLERVHYDEYGAKSKLELSTPEDKIKEVNKLIAETFPEKEEEAKKDDDKISSPSPDLVQGQGGEQVQPDEGTE